MIAKPAMPRWGARRAGGRPGSSTRRLLLLCIACAVPAWTALGALAVSHYRLEAAQRERQVLDVARDLRGRVESRRAASDVPAPGPELVDVLPREPGWTDAVQDRYGTVVAAAPGFERMRGEPLETVGRAAREAEDVGLVHAHGTTGTAMVVAFARLASGNGSVLVAVPERALQTELVAQLARHLGGAGLFLFANAAVAGWLMHRLRQDNGRLVQAADAQARTERLLQLRTRERDDALLAQAEQAREMRRDPLTRLANRTEFLRRLEARIRARAEVGGHVTVFFLDMDDFKAVNDGWGHAAGDALLCAFAARLLAGVREVDLSARLSGDEFAVLIDGLSAHEAEPIAQSLLDRLSMPYRVGLLDLRVSASIGAASYPQDGGDAASLLAAADAAMYAAKSVGKGDFRRSGWDALRAPGGA